MAVIKTPFWEAAFPAPPAGMPRVATPLAGAAPRGMGPGLPPARGQPAPAASPPARPQAPLWMAAIRAAIEHRAAQAAGQPLPSNPLEPH